MNYNYFIWLVIDFYSIYYDNYFQLYSFSIAKIKTNRLIILVVMIIITVIVGKVRL